jgi:hypothetical protein
MGSPRNASRDVLIPRYGWACHGSWRMTFTMPGRRIAAHDAHGPAAARSTRWHAPPSQRRVVPQVRGTDGAPVASAPEGVRASFAIAERCAFRLEQPQPTLPEFPPRPVSGRTSTWSGWPCRDSRNGWDASREEEEEAHHTQLAHELGVIARLRLAGFFLIVWTSCVSRGEMGFSARPWFRQFRGLVLPRHHRGRSAKMNPSSSAS